MLMTIKINVFEIAWLTDEQISMFKSDFRIVVDFLFERERIKIMCRIIRLKSVMWMQY